MMIDDDDDDDDDVGDDCEVIGPLFTFPPHPPPISPRIALLTPFVVSQQTSAKLLPSLGIT